MNKLIIVGLTLAGMLSAQASLFYQGTPGNGVDTGTGTAAGVGTFNQSIPDGSTVGVVNQINVSGLGNSLSTIAVTLNISGGVNSDLYAYLSYGGQSVVLLDRIGVYTGHSFGNTGNALNVTLDSTSGNVHDTTGNLTGTYQADGQTMLPTASAASFSQNGNGSITLNGQFGSMDPNGTWTLFFADVVGQVGGSTSTINGWSLDITAVPEPINLALPVFGGLMVSAAGVRHFLARRKNAAA